MLLLSTFFLSIPQFSVKSQMIVGHKSIMNLTERVYTHIEIRELIEAINQI